MDERTHLQLFDLIARQWSLPVPATGITFNADSSAAAFACADGSILLAATADKASPNRRTRRALDTGRLTIAPREKPPSPLKRADFTAGRCSAVIALGKNGFAFAKENGRINALTPGGIASHLPIRASGRITGLAASADGATLAFACEDQVWLGRVADGDSRALGRTAGAGCLALSPDSSRLAVGQRDGLTLWSTTRPDQAPVHLDLPAAASGITWRGDGRWLAVCLDANVLCLIDTESHEVIIRDGFPAPVRSAAFNDATATVVASGAFRVAAWTLPDHGDLVTARAGLVLVDAIATSPNRNLVAVGYANGLLSLAEIGRPSEVLLREDTGIGITALRWSGNGAYLAIVDAEGAAALVEFPDSMFKPQTAPSRG